MAIGGRRFPKSYDFAMGRNHALSECWGNEPVGHRLNSSVALTSALLEARDIEDVNVATLVFDDPDLLKRIGDK
jgi:hypothetical protein